MAKVKPKKHLGQHFLKEEQIAREIVNSLTLHDGYPFLLEIGPGMGVLTKYLINQVNLELHVIDLDKESIGYLKEEYPDLTPHIIEGDFLQKHWLQYFNGQPFGIIGNFPYNISSQIFFKVLELRDYVKEVVCMLQKEVAKRIASGPGNKTYGILSVLLQAYYEIDYLFEVKPEAFNPPPKVDSAVIRLKRNEISALTCDEKLFFRVVKQGFQNRRKTLRNALKPINLPAEINEFYLLDKRAEQLTVNDFVDLTQLIEDHWKK